MPNSDVTELAAVEDGIKAAKIVNSLVGHLTGVLSRIDTSAPPTAVCRLIVLRGGAE